LRCGWALAWLLVLLCLCIHRDGAAQNDEIDLGRDITFEIRPLTVIRLKSGGEVKGVLLEHDDKTVYRIRMRRPAVTRDIEKDLVAKVEPALTSVRSLEEQFEKHPSRTAGVARRALRFFRDPEVAKVVRERLERASGAGDAGAMTLLVELRIKDGEFESAESLARDLVKRKSSGLAYALLGRALGGQPAKRQAADETFQQALKLAPESELVMVAAAEFLLDTGRPDKAREIFTGALKRNPNSVSALVGAGFVSLRQGMIDEAVASFDKARLTIPATSHRDLRYIAATLGLASAKALLGQHAETTQLATEVLTLDTSNARAYGLQAYARLMAGGETEKQAFDLIAWALKGDPENPRFLALKAVLLTRQGMVLEATDKPQEAKVKFDEAGKLLMALGNPAGTDPWASYVYASMMFEQNRHSEALPLFQRAASLNASYAPAHQAVGATALALKEWVAAEEAYRKAIELDAEVAEYQAGLGLALLGRKQITQAREVLKKALQMDGMNVQALCGLGYIANLEKNELSMRDLFHRALACDGDCAYAAQTLKKLYTFRGKSMEYLDFTTNEIPPAWRVGRTTSRSLRPEPKEGVLLYQGQQGASASPRVFFGTTVKGEEFVRLEADLAIPPDNGCEMGLRVGSAVGANVSFYFEFGKDSSNRLAYRLQDYNGIGDWMQLGPWPENGKIRLAIETPDLSSGHIQLYVNGESKRSGQLKLARLGKVFAGVFLQAPAKTSVAAYVDNIVFISRKPLEEVPENGPTRLEPTETTKPDADKKDAPAEKKTPTEKGDKKAAPEAGKATKP